MQACASDSTLSRIFMHHGRDMNEHVKSIGL